MSLIGDEDTWTADQIRSATSGELERELGRVLSWIECLRYEYSIPYRISRDAILEEIDRRIDAYQEELRALR